MLPSKTNVTCFLSKRWNSDDINKDLWERFYRPFISALVVNCYSPKVLAGQRKKRKGTFIHWYGRSHTRLFCDHNRNEPDVNVPGARKSGRKNSDEGIEAAARRYIFRDTLFYEFIPLRYCEDSIPNEKERLCDGQRQSNLRNDRRCTLFSWRTQVL